MPKLPGFLSSLGRKKDPAAAPASGEAPRRAPTPPGKAAKAGAAKKKSSRGLHAPGIFALYLLAGVVVMLILRAIAPREAAPLAVFNTLWLLFQGAEDFLTLFPALALAALVVPFGFGLVTREEDPENARSLDAFSPTFLQNMWPSLLTAVVATVMFVIISLLGLPLVRDAAEGLRGQGRLWRQARARMQEHAAQGEWTDAAHYLGICDGIWPGSPELAGLRNEISVRTNEWGITPSASAVAATALRFGGTDADQLARARDDYGNAWPSLPGENPLNATQALALAETAMREARYYDAHWLATLGARLAGPGAVETAAAEHLASQAWNALSSLEPTTAQTRAYEIFHLKRDGYGALVSQEWIRAYYIFQELLALAPEDLDAQRYFTLSQTGTAQVAFFIDELETAEGASYTQPLFSLPAAVGGRLVIRFESLTVDSDRAYGAGAEILAFDPAGEVLWRAVVPYVKVLPLSTGSQDRVELILRALDREDADRRWEGEFEETLAGSAPREERLGLNLSWEDFGLLLDIQQGPEKLPSNLLLPASRLAAGYGYLPQMFQAELLRRFASPALFLVMAVLIIVAGWRYRARTSPRYLGVPMLAVLPVVFYGGVLFFHNALNDVCVWIALTLDFTVAAVILGAVFFLLLLLSLIILAAQRG